MIRQINVYMRDCLYAALAMAQSMRHNVKVMQQAGKSKYIE